MDHNSSSIHRPRSRRRWARPAAAAGVGGTALVIWIEEVMILAAEFIGVIFLPILAGIIYLFNHLLFRSTMPRRLDRYHTKPKAGENSNE